MAISAIPIFAIPRPVKAVFVIPAFFVILLLSPSGTLSAQRSTDELESIAMLGVSEVNSSETYTSSSFPHIVSLGTTGFLLDTYFKPTKRVAYGILQDESRRLAFRDTSMKHLFEVTHRIPADCRLKAADIDGQQVRLGYVIPEKSFRVYVVTVNLKERTSWYSVYESPLKRIQEMHFQGERLISIGDEMNQFGVWSLDLSTGWGVPHFYNMESEGKLLGSAINPQKEELLVLYNKRGRISVQPCNFLGEAVGESRGAWGVAERAKTADFVLEGERMYAMGNYLGEMKNTVAGLFFNTMSRGTYLSRLIPFSELKGLKALLTSEDEKGNRKVKRLLEKNKPLDLPHEYILHSVREEDSNLLWTFEMVAPIYKSETYYEENMGDRNEMKTRKIFVGWRNEYVLVVATDIKGTYQWDQAFPMDVQVQDQMQPRAGVVWKQGNLSLTMVREESVWKEGLSKRANGWERKPSKEVVLPKGGKPGSAIPWYGKYMIAFSLDGIGNASGTSWHSITSLWKVSP